MPTMTSCILNGQAIDIDAAIDMKDAGNNPGFSLRRSATLPLMVRRSLPSHFEHLERPIVSKSCCAVRPWLGERLLERSFPLQNFHFQQS